MKFSFQVRKGTKSTDGTSYVTQSLIVALAKQSHNQVKKQKSLETMHSENIYTLMYCQAL